jgi:aspartyl-tRNA synthetase
MLKTKNCGEINLKNLGEEVVLSGWVKSLRKHGQVNFIDLQDRTGWVQVVFEGEEFAAIEKVRFGFVLQVEGKVRQRAEGMENKNIPTGMIEIEGENFTVFSECSPYPFDLNDIENVDENLRLKYRYLDLRRPEMFQNLLVRHKVVKAIRDFLDSRGFLEVETPNLTRSTPEGARDFLVPSRLFPEKFFALPQSPQLFKQILMIAGVERYFQIARCFRDEDLRADRQPEFTQLDLEMSFVEEEDILNLSEELVVFIMERVYGLKIKRPFPRISYNDAINKYGSDKPDLRYGLEFMDFTSAFQKTEFKVIQNQLQEGGVVKGFTVKTNRKLSRKDYDRFIDKAKFFGGAGLFYYQKLEDGSIKSNIKKFITAEVEEFFAEICSLTPEKLVIFVSGQLDRVNYLLGKLREYFAWEFDLVPKNLYQKNKVKEENFKFCWVVDFPLFEWSEEEKRWKALHHPFTRPAGTLEEVKANLGKAKAIAYDLVLNGYEIAGGSLRIYDSKLQSEVFSLLGISEEEAKNRFSFFLEALKYGTPPHGGIAFGIERVLMGILNNHNIRQLIAFPKNTQGRCMLTDAPSGVSEKQLQELNLQVTKSEIEKEKEMD